MTLNHLLFPILFGVNVHCPQWCPEMLDLTFLDKFRALPNMTLLLNTWFTGVDKDTNGKVTVCSQRSRYEELEAFPFYVCRSCKVKASTKMLQCLFK